MAHATARGAYAALAERLNRFPQGAPPSDLLYRILALMFTEKEARLVARLPVRPVTARRAARIWGMREKEARGVLDGLADKCILLDMEGPNGTLYILPPPMAGFFEFSMMRVRDDIDQHLLAELFWQYVTVEDDFIIALFTNGDTQLGRVFVNEPALADARRPARDAPGRPARLLHVLDYERASEVIETAQHMGVGICYCRHKAEHVGKACKAPMNICMTFGGTADALIRHGYARRVDKAEGHGPARAGLRRPPGPVRRERPARRRLHLQLLRLLLRGDDRPAPVRAPGPGPHHQLPAARGRGDLQRLRQVRGRLPGRGDDPRLGQRPGQAAQAPRRAGRRDLPRLRRLHPRLPHERRCGWSRARSA